MPICSKCNKEYSSEYSNCPNCNNTFSNSIEKTIQSEQIENNIAVGSTTNTDSPAKTLFISIKKISLQYPKIAIPIALILTLLIGFGCGKIGTVKRSLYDNLYTNYQSEKSRANSVTSEYNEYKEKMQPYEAVQLTDAQNKAEKERQELADKKAAEEKAAAENQ